MFLLGVAHQMPVVYIYIYIYTCVFVIHAGLASGLGSAQHIRQRGMVPCSNHHVELNRRYMSSMVLCPQVFPSLLMDGWTNIYIYIYI
jgi:hypothetical protein